jgi:biopolymer transport protein ExbD
MAASNLPYSGEPLGEMNTTPLIDVMLVLLIMFIMAVPLASHAIEFDLPQGPNPPLPQPIRDTNRLTIAANGAIAWNGQSLSEAQLLTTLRAAERIVPEPLVLFEPDGRAPYGDAARVLRIVKGSGLSAFGFVGNDRFSQFDKAAPKP